MASPEHTMLFRSAAILLILLFASVSTVHSQSSEKSCTIPDQERIDRYFIDFEGLRISTSSDKVINRRRFTKNVQVGYSQRTYEKENFKVEVGISFYGSKGVAVEDAMASPSLVSGRDWTGSTIGDRLKFQRSQMVASSENVEYTTDIRVADDCYVVRGFWHDVRRKSYDIGPGLDDGKNIVNDLVNSIVETIDEDYYGIGESPQEVTTDPLPTQPPTTEAPVETQPQNSIQPVNKKPETYYPRSSTPTPISEKPAADDSTQSDRSFTMSVNRVIDFIDSQNLSVKLLILIVLIWGILLLVMGN